MSRAWASLLLTALVAALFGFGGAYIAVRAAAARPAPTAVGVREAVDDMLQHQLQLTPAQKAAVQTIDERYAQKHNLIWADIRMSNAELSGALAADMSMNQDVKNAIAEIQESVGRLQTETISYVLEVRSVLTPQQRLIFDERVEAALMRDAG